MHGNQNLDTLKTVLGDKYDIIKMIAEGGMGEIYLASHRMIDKKVAIKIIHQQMRSDQDIRRRFLQEAKLIASLDHPGIIQIMDYGSNDEFDYLVMPYVGEQTLQDKLFNQTFRIEESLSIMIPIIEAIRHAHQKNIIHRDIKPSNFLVNTEGRIILTDFGISKHLIEKTKTQANQTLGTPKFMSPEQIRGQSVDQRSDLYALGILFYRLLTGIYPFTADDPFAIAHMHIHQAPKHPSEIKKNIPAELGSIIIKLLEKNPSDRYPDGDTLLRDLISYQKKASAPEIKKSGQKTTRILSNNVITRKIGGSQKEGKTHLNKKDEMPETVVQIKPSLDPPTQPFAPLEDEQTDDSHTIPPEEKLIPSKWKKHQKWYLPIGLGIILVFFALFFSRPSQDIGQDLLLFDDAPKTSNKIPCRLRPQKIREDAFVKKFLSFSPPLNSEQAAVLSSLKVGIANIASNGMLFELQALLNSLPYITYKNEGDCDVLISHARESGQQKLTIANNLHEYGTSYAAELEMIHDKLPLEQIQQILMQNYCMNIFSALSIFSSQSDHRRMNLHIQGKTDRIFALGETLKFCMQANFDANCMLLDINSSGIYRIFPANRKESPRINSQEFHCSREIQASLPIGTEMIIAFGAEKKELIEKYNLPLEANTGIFQWSYNRLSKYNAVDFCSKLFLAFIQESSENWAASSKIIQVVGKK